MICGLHLTAAHHSIVIEEALRTLLVNFSLVMFLHIYVKVS